MVLNINKCHFMCLGKDTENEAFIFNNFIFSNSNEDKVLEIIVVNATRFHVTVSTDK